jgi:thioredoxin-related protein
MKTFLAIGFVAIIMLFAGYGGVVSIDRAFGESKINIESDLLECDLNETETLLKVQFSEKNGEEIEECALNHLEEKQNLEGSELPIKEKGTIRLGGLNFFSSLDAGLAEARMQGKPAFVYFRSSSCGWCKKFEDDVLTDSRVISILEISFIPVSIEVNQQKDVTNRFRIYGTPTMVFLRGDGIEVERIRGFVDARTFVAALDGIIDLFRRDYGKTV